MTEAQFKKAGEILDRIKKLEVQANEFTKTAEELLPGTWLEIERQDFHDRCGLISGIREALRLGAAEIMEDIKKSKAELAAL